MMPRKVLQLTMPDISHVMPIRNGGRFLKTTLEAIEANMMANDEIVLIDDGSSDNTFDIIRAFSKSRERVKIHRTTGVGLPSSLNLAVSISDHDWIARYDVDDRYSFNRTFHQRLAIQKDPTLVACFSDYSMRIEGKKFAGYIPSPIFHEATSLSLAYSQQTAHPSSVFNKSAFDYVGRYRDSDFPSEDLSLWLRLAKLGSLVSVGENLLQYRLSSKSTSALRRKDAKLKTKDLLKALGIDKKIIIYAYENMHEFLHAYDDYTFSNQRKLLFIRNLHRACELFDVPTKLKDSIMDYAQIGPMRLAGSAIQLAYYEVLRDSFRTKSTLVNFDPNRIE